VITPLPSSVVGVTTKDKVRRPSTPIRYRYDVNTIRTNSQDCRLRSASAKKEQSAQEGIDPPLWPTNRITYQNVKILKSAHSTRTPKPTHKGSLAADHITYYIKYTQTPKFSQWQLSSRPNPINNLFSQTRWLTLVQSITIRGVHGTVWVVFGQIPRPEPYRAFGLGEVK